MSPSPTRTPGSPSRGTRGSAALMLMLGCAVGAVGAVGTVGAADATAQSTREMRAEYSARLMAAAHDSADSLDQVRAAEAARFMRRFDEALSYLERATFIARTPQHRNAILRERLNYHLAVGGSIGDAQATFAFAAADDGMPVTVIAGWINAFPELLVGGAYDALVGSLSIDAEEPGYRCACYAQKAWMHRVAGNMETSRIYWDSLNASWTRQPEFSSPYDEADFRAQLARNLARAGKTDEARAELAIAMSLDVSAFESASILRRRAQTYAELGEVERAVADLETLLGMPSPVTVHTIRTRVTWEPVRDHPAFQALLRKHPVPPG